MSRYYPVLEPLSTQPLRPSGPEPLDPGRMPSWGRQAYRADLFDQPVGADEGVEYVEENGLQYQKGGFWDRQFDEDEPAPKPGPFGLSRNEQRAAMIGGALLVGYLVFRKAGPKKNPARRRRRRRR